MKVQLPVGGSRAGSNSTHNYRAPHSPECGDTGGGGQSGEKREEELPERVNVYPPSSQPPPAGLPGLLYLIEFLGSHAGGGQGSGSRRRAEQSTFSQLCVLGLL